MLSANQDRIEAVGEQLRAKIASKFTASTFLAGFALTVLTGQVFALWQGNCLPLLFPASVGAAFFAVLLFVGAIVKLDELTMPKRFWDEDSRVNDPLVAQGGYLTDEDLWELRKRMIFYWYRLTMAATGVTAAAVFLMLLPLGSLENEAAQRYTFFCAVAGIGSAVLYGIWIRFSAYRDFRPLLRPVD